MEHETVLLNIDKRLGLLEKGVVAAYQEQEYHAQIDALNFVRLPRDKVRGFAQLLKPLFDELYSSGEQERLMIVSDMHDELRIRMIYLKDLLERDIPFTYLERALSELKEFKPDKPTVATASSEPFTGRKPRPEEEEGVVDRIFGSFSSMFSGGKGRKGSDASATSAKRPTGPSVPNRVDTSVTDDNGRKLPEHVQRVVYLHNLMEDDEENLVKPEQKIPHIGDKIRIPKIFGKFTGKDFGEAHFGQRVHHVPKVARTPEELRRKLELRQKQEAEQQKVP